MSRPLSTQAERLQDAFRRFRDEFSIRVSHRDLALRMRPDASPRTIDSLKSQISKWRSGPGGISDDNAYALADAFNELRPGAIPRDWFLKNRDRPQTWAERMRSIAAEALAPQQAEYQSEVRELREELARIRKEGERHHEEVLEEIRRMRDAS